MHSGSLDCISEKTAKVKIEKDSLKDVVKLCLDVDSKILEKVWIIFQQSTTNM